MASTIAVPPFLTCRGHVEHATFAPPDVAGLPWDMDTRLVVTQSVSVDVDALRDCCGLAPDAPMALVLDVVCDQTYWTARARTLLPASSTHEVQAVVEVPPRTVSGKLVTRSAIVLAADTRPVAPRGASRLGSLVAGGDESRHVLEGSGDQFPSAVVPFARTGRHPTARWTLEYAYESPDQPALGTVRLMLNGDSRDVQRLVARGDEGSDDPVRAGIGRELRRFVVGDLVRQAVSDRSFADDGVWPEGSLGAVVEAVLDQYADGLTLVQLRSMQQSDRSRFEQVVQGLVPEASRG